MNAKSKKRLMLAIVIAFLVTIVMSPLLKQQLAPISEKFDPVIHTCSNRSTVYCSPHLLCVSCMGVYVNDFPECCADWTVRNNTDRYPTCIEEMFMAYNYGLVNATDFQKFFNFCTGYDKTIFLEQLENLSREYERKYNATLK
jgi:hypothetical protein